MRKMMKSLAVVLFTAGITDASDMLIKLGYESIEDRVLNQKLDLDGFSASVEFPLSVANKGYLCGFIHYSDLNLKQSQILGVNIDADGELLGIGLKYSFSGDVTKDMDTATALDVGLDSITPYVKLGYEKAEVSGSIALAPVRVNLSDDDSGPFYGIGVETMLSDEVGLFVEWIKHEADVLDEAGLKFGVMVRF